MTKYPRAGSKAEPIPAAIAACFWSSSSDRTDPVSLGAYELFVRAGGIPHRDCETARTCRVTWILDVKASANEFWHFVISPDHAVGIRKACSLREKFANAQNPALVTPMPIGPFVGSNVVRRNDKMTEVIAGHGSTT